MKEPVAKGGLTTRSSRLRSARFARSAQRLSSVPLAGLAVKGCRGWRGWRLAGRWAVGGVRRGGAAPRLTPAGADRDRPAKSWRR